MSPVPPPCSRCPISRRRACWSSTSTTPTTICNPVRLRRRSRSRWRPISRWSMQTAGTLPTTRSRGAADGVTQPRPSLPREVAIVATIAFSQNSGISIEAAPGAGRMVQRQAPGPDGSRREELLRDSFGPSCPLNHCLGNPLPRLHLDEPVPAPQDRFSAAGNSCGDSQEGVIGPALPPRGRSCRPRSAAE
jgi:hypothetical protein